jgi:DNA-binding transcriptional LysR family regulator
LGVTDLTIAGLRVVLEVARTGTLTVAAENLGYTQSAVSRQVAAMEKAARTPLFERHARGVRPTPAGATLLRHAGRILDGVTAATHELEGMRDRLAGRLAVGGFPTATAVLLPRAIASFQAAHPGVQVRLMEASTPRQLAALRRHRLEVAVLATGEGLPDYDLEGLRLTPLRGLRGAGVAVAETHPFASRPWVTPDDLVDQAWIIGPTRKDGPEFGPWPALSNPTVAFAAGDWSTRLGLVAAGLGIALVPGLAADIVPRAVRWIPVRDPDAGLQRTVSSVTLDRPSRAASAFVDAIDHEIEMLTSAESSAG